MSIEFSFLLFIFFYVLKSVFLLCFLPGSSPAARAEEDWEEADEDEADQSESHVKGSQGIVIQAHMKAVLSSDQLLSPQSAALAHSRSSSKQTSCASGCVKLSCLCHHLFHLVWLNLNDWAWTVHIKWGNFFTVKSHHNSCQDCFLFLSNHLLKVNQSSVWKLWSFLNFTLLGRNTLFGGIEPHF